MTVRGDGRGGRKVELLLALALGLRGLPDVHALASDTDGVGSSEEIAGALISPDILARAHSVGVDPASALAANDGHTFFEKLCEQIVTGPTLTNVNAFRVA